MKLRNYSNADEFYAKVKSFLTQREAENNVIFGIISGLRIGLYAEQPPYMACVEEDGEVMMVALRTPPHYVLSSTSHSSPATKALVDDLFALYGTSLPGINIPADSGEEFCARWQEVSGQSYTLEMRMRIYKLTELKPPTNVAGVMRLATANDEFLVDWMMGFDEDAFGHADRASAEENYHRFMDAPPTDRGFGIWEVDGTAVSMAAYVGPTPNGMRVAYVYTPPEHRRKGYASAVTAAVTQQIFDMGKAFSFLTTDLTNPTSNHIYQAIGYQTVSDVHRYRFE